MLFLVIVAKQTRVTLSCKDYGFICNENVFPNCNEQVFYFFENFIIHSNVFYITMI